LKRRLITLLWIGFIPFLIFTPSLAFPQFTNAALDSLRREFSKASTDTARIRIQLQMATIAWRSAYNEEALKYAKEALSSATQINNEALQADAHRLMGIAYTNKGEYDKAIIHYELAQSIYVNLPVIDTLNLARTLNNIGLLYSYQGYNYVSLQYYQRALHLRKLIKDNIGISNSITNIGRIKLNSKDYDSAYYYFRQAYNIRLKENDIYAISASLADMAEVFRMSGNSDSAVVYFQKAYELAIKNNVKYNAAFALSSISNIYAGRKQYAEALRYALLSDSLAVNESNWQRVRSLNSLAQAYVGLSKFKEAQRALLEARRLGNVSQTRVELVNTYWVQYKLDSAMGNYKDALGWLTRHYNLKDSIATANKINQALELQYVQEINDKNEALILLRATKQLQELQKKAQHLSTQITLIVIAALLLVVAGVVYIWLQTKRQHRQLAERQKIIEKFNEELAAGSEAYQQKASELEEVVFLLKKTNAELKELNREKDGLMSIMAHDLKTPLDGIKGLAEVIRMPNNLDENQLECLRLIELSVERGVSLIEDILFLNAHEGHHQPPKFEQIDLRQLLESYMQTHINHAAKKHIEFEWQNEVYVPIISDAKLLLRIIDNLLSNAIKFTFTGYKVSFHAGIDDGKLVISVSDQGQGIPIDEQKWLFTKFKRLSAIPTGNESSTGLGLAIVKQLVDELHGEIKVESAKGVGSTFTIYLPLQPV
jgi:signal transduction histidine kinase